MIDWQSVDLDAPYESPTRKLTVGDPVRVRLNAECPWYEVVSDPGDGHGIEGHALELDGATGNIANTPREFSGMDMDNHDIYVVFDPPIPSKAAERLGFAVLSWAFLAPNELEALEATS